MSALLAKLAEPSTKTGLGKVLLSAGVIYAGLDASACAAPGAPLLDMSLRDLADHFGLTGGLGALGVLLGVYDVLRPEAVATKEP